MSTSWWPMPLKPSQQFPVSVSLALREKRRACSRSCWTASTRTTSGPSSTRRELLSEQDITAPSPYAALRHRGHGACFVRSLQHQRRSGRSGRGHPEGTGGVRLMPDLRELYQEVILEHSKAPRNYR